MRVLIDGHQNELRFQGTLAILEPPLHIEIEPLKEMAAEETGVMVFGEKVHVPIDYRVVEPSLFVKPMYRRWYVPQPGGLQC